MASILVVDDAMFMRQAIRLMLEPNGHEMIGEASNGIEAIEKYMELKPDVVLLDISMPEMNGIEALRRIKILNKDAKVIICSAIGQQAMLAKAVEYGADNFIVKPFDEEHLIAAIDKAMRK